MLPDCHSFATYLSHNCHISADFCMDVLKIGGQNHFMNTTLRKILVSALVLVNVALAARAEWPARVFAPYMYIGGGQFKLTDGNEACGLKYYTLAFIIARQEGGRTNTQ